jgi:hypothetical protein
MGCNHCMEESVPEGDRMSIETFLRVKTFVERTYKSVKIMFLSGGEPTEHPLLFDFLHFLKGWNVIVMSNGLFLTEKEKAFADQLLSHDLTLQIYNDPRYYPKKVEPFIHPKVVFGDQINLMSPLGRARQNQIPSTRQSPMCFNLRSCAKTLKDFSEAVMALRMSGKMCTPSIDVYGNILAGESRFCHKIGTVESSEKELLENLFAMKCNKCRLEDGLPFILKNIIHGK